MEAGLQEKTDGDLVAAVQAGRREAYGPLIRRYTGRVFGVCLGILGDWTAAEDAAQEVFLKGLNGIGELRDGGSFGGWITRIARNLCQDEIRIRGRRRELLEENPAPAAREPDEFSDLYEALARLPQQDRMILALYYLDGYSITGVAEEMGVTGGAAYTRLSRARRALRVILEKRGSS
jgi:RNA polymerase sigma-70 factor (ECF subfamily)